MRLFFAALVGFAFSRSFVPETGWPEPGGKEVVVTVVEVAVTVVVVIGGEQAPKLPVACAEATLVGPGQASWKSFENPVSPVRVRLNVPPPGVSVAAGLPNGSGVPS